MNLAEDNNRVQVVLSMRVSLSGTRSIAQISFASVGALTVLGFAHRKAQHEVALYSVLYQAYNSPVAFQ